MKLRHTFLLMASVIGLSVPARATVLSGTVNYPNATGVTGRLLFSLSQMATQSPLGGCGGPAVLAPTTEITVNIVNGALSGSPSIVGNDCMSPSGLYYRVRLIDGNGNVLFVQNWQISGANMDVGTVTPLIVPQGTASIGSAFIDNLIVSTSLTAPNIPKTNSIQTWMALQSFTGGIKSNVFSSTAALPATAGTLRLGSGEGIAWRNNGNTGNLQFFTDSSDRLAWSGTSLFLFEGAAPTCTGGEDGIFADSSLHRTRLCNTGMASTAVGIDTTDTLQNKGLTGAANGNSITLSPDCGFQSAKSPITGNSADQNYYSCTLAASAFAAGKGIRFTTYLQHTTGTAAITYKLSFGGTSTTGIALGVALNDVYKIVYDVFNITTGTQFLGSDLTEGTVSGSSTLKLDTASVNTTSGTVAVNLTFNVANTDQITPKSFFGELIQ